MLPDTPGNSDRRHHALCKVVNLGVSPTLSIFLWYYFLSDCDRRSGTWRAASFTLLLVSSTSTTQQQSIVSLLSAGSHKDRYKVEEREIERGGERWG